MVDPSFFGTDGIRGRTSLETMGEEASLDALLVDRTLTPVFMRVLGEALSYVQPSMPGEGRTVVIGWDRRPHNAALVEALTLGLRLTGSTVVHVGDAATPTLHAAVIEHRARMGCMITASHNPVSDSGIKVFDAHGYKSTRALEDEISRTVHQLSGEDREVDQIDQVALSRPDSERLAWGRDHHPAWLHKRWNHYESLLGGFDKALSAGTVAQPFLLDGAKGFASDWLASFLTHRGFVCEEVSGSAVALNEGCGAGDMSPTQVWTHEEAASSNHVLLRRLSPAPPGQWVGAALDGDGDRCLLIEATASGFKVVDGDAMAATILEAGRGQPWSFAASIESDIALSGRVAALHPSNQAQETAVGDRWLSFALRPAGGGLLTSSTMPLILGVEDSGHLVMPAPTGKDDTWSLVGDGAASLIAVLMAANRRNDGAFVRGWKSRVSIANSHRERWHDQADIFNATAHALCEAFEGHGFHAGVRTIAGEDNLLLVHGTKGDQVASFGIRNSGTQAKTSLSVRLSPGVDPEPFKALLHRIKSDVERVLV